MPLYAFFGGAGTSLHTDMTITTGSTDEAAAAALDILGRGITTIKVKIGGSDLTRDLERIIAIHAVAPDAPPVADPERIADARLERERSRYRKLRLEQRSLQWLSCRSPRAPRRCRRRRSRCSTQCKAASREG